jgi:hypothetical protein
LMGGNSTTSRGGREPEAAACQEAKVDDEARIGAGDDDIHHPKQQSTSNRGEQMQMDVCALRGKGEGGDRGTVDDNDDEAIGGDDARRLKQRSTNTKGEKNCGWPFARREVEAEGRRQIHQRPRRLQSRDQQWNKSRRRLASADDGQWG